MKRLAIIVVVLSMCLHATEVSACWVDPLPPDHKYFVEIAGESFGFMHFRGIGVFVDWGWGWSVLTELQALGVAGAFFTSVVAAALLISRVRSSQSLTP